MEHSSNNTQEIPGFIQDQIKQVFNEVESFTPSSNIVPEIFGFTPNQTQHKHLQRLRLIIL